MFLNTRSRIFSNIRNYIGVLGQNPFTVAKYGRPLIWRRFHWKSTMQRGIIGSPPGIWTIQ